MILRKQLSYIFFSLLLLFACQPDDASSRERGFDESKIEKMNASDRYDYDKTIETRRPNIVLRALASFLSFIARLFNNVIGYILLAGLIFLLVYILVKNSDKIFGRRNEINAPPVRIINEDNIEQVDYDKLLAMALKENNFSLAVRYQFLKSLKHLQKLELIKWDKDKTNYEYLMEVPDNYYEPLNKLISIYEYVWYGQFQASEGTYQKLAGRALELQSIKRK